MLEVENVSYAYDGVTALFDISLTVEQGEVVSLIGGNGAGKSTTLENIAGLLSPGSGSIRFKGRDITSGAAYDTVSEGISLVPEGRRVFPEMTVRENLAVAATTERAKTSTDESLETVLNLFPRLEARLDQNAGTMSGGEQQMLAIGRGLMSAPELLLLDEPSLGLAPDLVDTVFSSISRINEEEDVTVLLAGEEVQRALEVADRAYVIEKGNVSREGESTELADDEYVKRAFLGTAD